MNSISRGQLCAMLLITDIFGLFCLSGSISLNTLWGYLAAAALQFLAALVCAAGDGELKMGAKLFLAGYSVFCGGVIFSELWRTGQEVYIPWEKGVTGRLMTAGLIAAVCIYIASAGLRAVGRAAVIAAAAGVLLLCTDLLSALLSADLGNIWLPERRSTARELLRGFAASGSFGSLAVLLGKVRGDRGKAVVLYFAVRTAVSAAALTTALAVAGGIAEMTDFPVMTAAQLSQPFEAQRIDSLFMVVFSASAVFAAELQTMTAVLLMEELFPKLKFRCGIAAAAMIAAALVIWGRELMLLRGAGAAAVLMAGAAGKKISAAKNSG